MVGCWPGSQQVMTAPGRHPILLRHLKIRHSLLDAPLAVAHSEFSLAPCGPVLLLIFLHVSPEWMGRSVSPAASGPFGRGGGRMRPSDGRVTPWRRDPRVGATDATWSEPELVIRVENRKP